MAWYDPGRKVVCIKRGAWETCDRETGAFWRKQTEPRPAFKEICVVRAVDRTALGLWIEVEGYRGWLRLARFRPVDPLRKSTEKGVQLLKDIAARKREPEEV